MLERIVDGRTDLVFDYVAQGQSAQSADQRGTRLILWCAYYGDVSAIRFLLANGESLESLGRNFDLNGAAFHGHWQLCQFLIENGADVNHPLPDTGETPLHAALCKANRPICDFVVEILLANGASPNRATKPSAETGAFMRDCRTRDMNGDSPLTWASWHLRPATILRRLCFGEFSIHPENTSSYDHGAGWEQPKGRPHV
jgi:ankyrin repeat protein